MPRGDGLIVVAFLAMAVTRGLTACSAASGRIGRWRRRAPQATKIALPTDRPPWWPARRGRRASPCWGGIRPRRPVHRPCATAYRYRGWCPSAARPPIRSFVQDHAEAPQRRAFDLRLGAVRMNDGARINHQREFLDCNSAAGAIDAHARDAVDRRHVALLTEAGGDAKPDIFRQRRAPGGFLRGTRKHRSLSPRSTDSIWRRSGISPGTVQQLQPECHRIDSRGVRCLVHEAFHRPIRPARPNRA